MKSAIALLVAVIVSNTALAGFDDVEIKSSLKADYVIGLVVSDQRESVLKWGAAENLIGAHHSGMFKNRKELLTGSGEAVSTEMAEGLRKQFSQNWISVAPIPTTAKESKEALESKIRKARLHRTFLLTLKSLWVEAPYSGETAINFGFVVSVLDENAVVLSSVEREGIQGASQWGYWGAAEVFGMLISNVLEDQKLIGSLMDAKQVK